jgi:predicted DNA-binding protein YlxM (UPF0122 family)
MSEKDFKKQNKPAMCTNPVWRSVMPEDKKDELTRKIRQESIELYGQSMDECPKRLVCLGNDCLGRTLPILSPTAKPYIEALKKKFKVVNNEMFLTKCDQCPIQKKCTSTCHQINDYLNRGNKKEPEFVFQEISENVTETILSANTNTFTTNKDIPFDCLNNRRQQVIKKYLYEGKDFITIAKELNMKSQAWVKYEFYAGLTKLSEYAAVRTYLAENKDKLTKGNFLLLENLYIKNESMKEVAKKEGCSKQAVQQRLTRILDSGNVKWITFVRKENKKLIYNVPMVFK